MPTALSELLATLIRPSHQWHFTVLSSWHTIMGTLSSKALIEHIEGNTITIGVYEACWLQELYLLSPLLRDKINQILDQPHVKEIRFKRVMQKKERSYAKKKHYVPQQRTSTPLTTYEQDALSKITNHELQQALLTFRARCQGSCHEKDTVY